LFSFDLPFVSLSREARMSAIVSQLSKIFGRYQPTRFLNGSAKVSVHLFLPNFSGFIFQQNPNHLGWKSIVFERSGPVFSKRTAKI